MFETSTGLGRVGVAGLLLLPHTLVFQRHIFQPELGHLLGTVTKRWPRTGAFLSSPIRFPWLGALLDYKLNSACMHAATAASIEKPTVLPICRPIKTIVKRAWNNRIIFQSHWIVHFDIMDNRNWTMTCFIYILDSSFSSSSKFWSSKFPSSSICS